MFKIKIWQRLETAAREGGGKAQLGMDITFLGKNRFSYVTTATTPIFYS